MAPVPRKAAPPQFRRGELRRLVLAALRNGPVRNQAVVVGVLAKRPNLASDKARTAVANALWKLEAKGIVRHRRRA